MNLYIQYLWLSTFYTDIHDIRIISMRDFWINDTCIEAIHESMHVTDTDSQNYFSSFIFECKFIGTLIKTHYRVNNRKSLKLIVYYQKNIASLIYCHVKLLDFLELFNTLIQNDLLSRRCYFLFYLLMQRLLYLWRIFLYNLKDIPEKTQFTAET